MDLYRHMAVGTARVFIGIFLRPFGIFGRKYRCISSEIRTRRMGGLYYIVGLSWVHAAAEYPAGDRGHHPVSVAAANGSDGFNVGNSNIVVDDLLFLGISGL